ncbi:MAG TPA: hypothetical protein VIJ93_08145, partial [bacterium]
MNKFLIFFLLSVIPCSAQNFDYQLNCDWGKKPSPNLQVNGYTVKIDTSNQFCKAIVIDPNQKTIFECKSSGIQIFAGTKFNTGGQPLAFIQSDGQPYRFFIISLGENSGLIQEIDNECGFWLQNNCEGRPRIWTCDGAFQEEKELRDIYMGDLIVPNVELDLRGNHIIDVTSEDKDCVDKNIAVVRKKLKDKDVRAFLEGTIKDDFHRGMVKGRILHIVLSYLYSGRENEA